jgi:hypothetical protein
MAFSFSAWTPRASEVAPRERSSASECSSSASETETARGASDGELRDPSAPVTEHAADDPAYRAPVAARDPASVVRRDHRAPCLQRLLRVSGHLAPSGVDADQRVDGVVILAGPVARDGDRVRPDRRRERRVNAALEIEGGAPVGEAAPFEPRDPPRVARVRIDLLMPSLAKPRGQRLQRGHGVLAGVCKQERPAALADRGIAGHAMVAFEDHPRLVMIDELAGLLGRHLGRARPGGVLGERERDQVGAVVGRRGAKHRDHLRASGSGRRPAPS